MTKHTKGPWGIKPTRDHKNHLTIWDCKDNLHIAYVTNDGDNSYYIDDDIQDANARLVAAAPDLLAALESCLWMIESHEGKGNETDAQIDSARAAIAKALGES